MASEPRTIKGPCFDCGQQCLSWCLADDPPQPESDDTAPIPKQPEGLRPPRMSPEARQSAVTHVRVEPLQRAGYWPKPYKRGVRAAYAILAVLCALCVLASLSGCLTAVKIGQWQRAVYGWGMDPKASKPCQVASAEASAYLANANQRLAEAGKLTDLASDSRARELVTSAALACGRRMP